MTLDAVIVAGGSSRRMGFDKLTASFAGRSVLAHAVAAFDATKAVRRIVVVCAKGREQEFCRLVAGFEKVAEIVPGGTERADSVQAGFAALGEPSDWVAVHDAARPLVRPQAIEECYAAARRHGAAALAERVVDTLHRTDSQNQVQETVPRDNLWRVQTPQIVPAHLFPKLHQKQRNTDEISEICALGLPAVMVESGSPNLKLTVASDLSLAEALYSVGR